MVGNFIEMDTWTSDQVAKFKQEGQNKQKEKLLRAFAPELAAVPGTLIAEGDSWFDYLPGTDIIDCLRVHYDYIIENYAKAGDTLENLIYGTGINRHFERTSPSIRRVQERLEELRPKVFLFSGGGNDVAGEQFESYLNHKESGFPALREEFVNKTIDVVFRKYFEDLIVKVASVSPVTHIVVHGYAHTLPTGEGVDFLFFSFAGPWLRPALARKGIFEPNEQRAAVFSMIDKYNQMLFELDQLNDKFHYIDLRDIIAADTDWVNELHLKNSAYARVTQRIHEKIQSI